MPKKKLLSFLIVFILAIMIGCSSEDEAEGKTEPQRDEEPEEEEVVETEADDGNEELEEEQAPVDEEQMIEGKVIVKESENTIRVEADTNLIEGTKVEVSLRRAFGILDTVGNVSTSKGEINEDGTVIVDFEISDEKFFEKYKGLYAELAIEVQPEEFIDNETKDTYGPHGENFKGPLVYQYEVFEPKQKLSTIVNILVGDEKTEYAIEIPEREPLPDDYGETDIWMEAEVVDNDHRFLYVEGKTNILEGVTFSGNYYSDEDATLSQVWTTTNTYVEPDGTFSLPVRYDSITEEGYIKIQSAPIRSHNTKKMIYSSYGENFEKLSGDVVIQEEDHQEIELILKTEGMDIDAPEDSLITEDDGELKIQVPDDVLFDFDKSDLKGEAKNTLDDVIAILEDLDEGEDIQIHGHTDNEGEPDYNLNLSEERAASVEKYLTKHGDLNHLNITKEGFGETKPVESNEDEEGRKRNRRVEIIFNKK